MPAFKGTRTALILDTKLTRKKLAEFLENLHSSGGTEYSCRKYRLRKYAAEFFAGARK
jgi:hypothetical protein